MRGVYSAEATLEPPRATVRFDPATASVEALTAATKDAGGPSQLKADSRSMPDPVLTSTVTCPECGAQTEAEMPTDGCQFFWECPACDATLRPVEGDCCVFCSYGSVPCPPVQSNESCC